MVGVINVGFGRIILFLICMAISTLFGAATTMNLMEDAHRISILEQQQKLGKETEWNHKILQEKVNLLAEKDRLERCILKQSIHIEELRDQLRLLEKKNK